MTSTPQQHPVFDMLAHYATAHVLFAAHQVGLVQQFQVSAESTVDVVRFAQEQRLHESLLFDLAQYLVRRGVLEHASTPPASTFRLTALGQTLIADGWIAYIVFYLGGYRNVLDDIGGLVKRESSYGVDLRRDGYYVALGSQLIGDMRQNVSYQTLQARVRELSPARLLDLGCGSAAFLLNLVEQSQAKDGIGVDIDPDACVLARKRIEDSPFADIVRVYEGSLTQLLGEQPELAGEVDVVTAVFLVHEFFSLGMDVAADRIRELGSLLRPATGRLLILDKHTDLLDTGTPLPYFTEFKLIHDLTGQVLYSKAEWRQVFAKAGLEAVETQVLPVHTGNVLWECRRV